MTFSFLILGNWQTLRTRLRSSKILEEAKFFSSRNIRENDFHFLALTLAVVSYSGFLVTSPPMTSTPTLCGTCLFRRLPHFSGRCHSKKCRAIFMFGWPQAFTIKFPFSSVLETTPIAIRHMTARRLVAKLTTSPVKLE